MKKSLIAVAVAGVMAAPMAAQADAGVYGRVNVGIWNNLDEDSATYWAVDEGMSLQSISSRFGAKGSEDLGNGLTAHYRYEFGVDATSASFTPGNRLSWVGLSGDFGMVKAGRIWSAWYDYLGWNVDRSQFLGGTGYYGYGTGLNIGPGTRSSDTIQYTYGGGGYSSDPFTFSIEAVMDGQSAGGNPDGFPVGGGVETDNQDFDLITLAGQGTFGDIQVNAAHRMISSNFSGNDTVEAEPTQTGFGVRWNAGDLFIGATYAMTDFDVDGDGAEPSYIDVLATYDMGGGLSGQLSFSSEDSDGEAGATGDATGVFAQLNKSLSSRTNVYVEYQNVDIDDGNAAGDGALNPQVLLIGMGHSF